jgi:hypothetical protein
VISSKINQQGGLKMKAKKEGFGLEVKSFTDEEGDYIVLKTPDGKRRHGTYHVFREVSAKMPICHGLAIKDDAEIGKRTTQQWGDRLWKNQ